MQSVLVFNRLPFFSLSRDKPFHTFANVFDSK